MVALALGAVAAVMLVAGHHPWDGAVVATFAWSHGLHRGDVLAVGPAVVSIGLARWCLLQGRAPRPSGPPSRAAAGPTPSGGGAAHR